MDHALPTPAPAYADPFAFLAAVVRGRTTVADTYPSSLPNVLVVRFLDAARRSAATGRTVTLVGG